jgi:hypothetical protein
MATYFVDGSTGNDANDALDNIGVALATATWTEATLTLTQAGHGYTFAAGDVIYITGGTGATVGLYEVASSTADDIVLVETSTLPGVGNASNFAAGDLGAGNITSSDGPYLTIQTALAAVSAGDHVWVRSGTDYNEELTVVTNGTQPNPIVIEGYTTTLRDEGVAVNDGTTGSLTKGFTPTAGSNYYVLKNFYFKDFSTGFGISTGDFISLYRVEVSGSAGGGIILDDHCVLLGCHVHDNTGKGFNIGSVGVLYGCVAANNGGDGIYATAGIFVSNCLCYDNAGNGISWVGTNVYGLIADNTVVAASASGNTGIRLGVASTSNKYLCCNNTVSGYSGSGGKGIETSAIKDRAFLFNNNVFDCETNYSGEGDLGGGTTTDPDFVNAASDDYTPDTASPLIVAGFDVTDVPNAPTQTAQAATVGALLRAVVSAGGLLMPNKRGGKQ